jgi:hypothetical protein
VFVENNLLLIAKKKEILNEKIASYINKNKLFSTLNKIHFPPHYDVFSYFQNVICGQKIKFSALGPQSQLIVYSLTTNVSGNVSY